MISPSESPGSGRWVALAILVIVAAGWEFGSSTGLVSRLYFPAPSAIARTLGALIMNGELLAHLAATLRRLILALLLGGVPGLAIGLAMGWARRLREALDPLVTFVHPLPKIALLPLALVLFGFGESSRVSVPAVAAFFPILINAMTGVRQIRTIYFEVAESHGASLATVLARVVLPGSLPLLLAGIRIGANVALLVTIAVEMVAADRGLGTMLWLARETLNMEEMYAGLLIITVVGATVTLGLKTVERRLAPWQSERPA